MLYNCILNKILILSTKLEWAGSFFITPLHQQAKVFSEGCSYSGLHVLNILYSLKAKFGYMNKMYTEKENMYLFIHKYLQ